MAFSATFPKPQLPEAMKDLKTPPKLHLYTAGTPNGYKPSILLEELIRAYPDKAHNELSYDFYDVDISKDDQKTPGFLAINPNGRIPALVDDNVGVEGGHNVFESGSILLWLVEQYDTDNKFWFSDPITRSKAISWTIWIQSGLAPMQGQANHFFRYAPESIPYGIKRYQDETARLYGVIEKALGEGKGEWIVGDKYSIVDINAFGWVRRHQWAGVDIKPFPRIAAWIDRIHKRPGAWAGLGVPVRKPVSMTKEEEEEEAKRAREWILKGQQK